MSALSEFAVQQVGSMALLSRKTGITERLLREFGDGALEPDDAHVRRLKQVLGQDIDCDALFPHRKPTVSVLDVSEAKVLAVRDEFVVRPADVKADDLVRYVAPVRGGGERLAGWVKVREDAQWVRGDLVSFALKDGSVVECHPAQTVTVARKRNSPAS